ncbi:MAG: TonB-dependent receptor [Candidatus Zixiibacteriota bacterium]
MSDTNRFRQTLNVLTIALLVLCGTVSALASVGKTSTITGRIVEEQTGEGLIGVTVMIEGTSQGAITDMDGNFRIKNVATGTYTLVISSVTHQGVTISGVEVTESEPVSLNLTLSPAITEVEGITVKATQLKNTHAAMLSVRQKSAAISDAISADEIQRSGSGDAAEAMTKVVGASVVGGKYVYVRGLGDRYANTLLNSSPIPSPDPDKQAAPMDLIPSGLLDNIVVEKTFTPDKPGNFAGGSVNLKTRDYPERRMLVFSTSSGYNSVTTDKEILTYDGSSSDWLGYDGGKRDIPSYIIENEDLQDQAPQSGAYLLGGIHDDSVATLAAYMDTAAKSFDPVMTPKVRKHAPVNQSHSVSYADLFNPFGRPLGILASFSYSKKYSAYNDGFSGKYRLTGSGSTALTVDHELEDIKGTEEVLWGGLFTIKYGITDNDKIGLTFMRDQHGESVGRYLTGTAPEHLDPDQSLRSYVLSYVERNLTSIQLNGEHLSPFGLGSLRADWQLSHAETTQQEPDIRFFTDYYYEYEDQEFADIDTAYRIDPSRFPVPSRGWRKLEESNNTITFNLSIPVSHTGKIKTGFNWLSSDRTHQERNFDYQYYGEYRGDPNEYATYVGLTDIDTLPPFNGDTLVSYQFDNVLLENVELRNQYEGSSDVKATYAMLQTPLLGNISFVGGARYEKTNLYCVTQDSKYEPGEIDAEDILPSVGFIYHATDNTNFRLSYGRTIALPTIREMSPFASEDFGVARVFVGNPNLKRTLIDNYDLRWEWFTRPGEVIAMSGFYKLLRDPIELTFVANNDNLQPENSYRATVYGLEFEIKTRLDHINRALSNFSFGGNLTLAHSEVDILESDMEKIRAINPDAESTRPMAGQSPLLANIDLSYDNANTGTSIGILYNVFGDRLAIVARGATPDIYEQSRHQLDLVASQRMFGLASVKFSVKNILDEDVLFLHQEYEGLENLKSVYSSHSRGITYSVGVSYNIW